MDELIRLGFNIPRILTNKQGIEIHVPEDENSNNWFVHIPQHLIEKRLRNQLQNKLNNGFDYYLISKDEVLRVVKIYQGL
jgi:hypothetical protein